MSPVEPNGTDAKDVVLHFVRKTEMRATSSFIGRSINQAKALLKAGYTKDEIIRVIDYIIDVKEINMYSFGFLNASIHKFLNDAKNHIVIEHVKQQMSNYIPSQSEVNDNGSTERNRNKTEHLGIKSRLREKYHFDLFEES